jgi:hypothetical protein
MDLHVVIAATIVFWASVVLTDNLGFALMDEKGIVLMLVDILAIFICY